MRRKTVLAAAGCVCLVLAICTVVQGDTHFLTWVNREYDEQTVNTNQIDVDVTGNLAEFKSRLEDAYDYEFGGTVNWQDYWWVADYTGGAAANRLVRHPFWVQTQGGTKTYFTATMVTGGMPIVPDGSGRDLNASEMMCGWSDKWFHGISGDMRDTTMYHNVASTYHASADPSTFTLDFWSDKARTTRPPICEFGVAVVSGDGAYDISITANFSGGGSQTLSDNILCTTADDTFFYFCAPANEFITSVDFDNTSSSGRIVIDDWGFVLKPVPGDADNDGLVDGVDFTYLKANFGQAGKSWAEGDFNGDGLVDGVDFTYLKHFFGWNSWPHPPAGAAVPEPATLLLVCAGAASLLLKRRRK